MEAKDLRLGNLYRYLHEESESIHTVDIDFLKTQLAYDEDPEDEVFCRGWHACPIPLTEEWLIKLGFIKMPVNGYDYLLKISAATLQCRCNGDKWYFQFNDTYFGEMFPYVHQVQNFCASLGKELTSA